MQDFIKNLLKTLTQILLGDYSAYFIYSCSNKDTWPDLSNTTTQFRVLLVDEATIKASPDPLIEKQAGYAGDGSYSYACYDGDRIVGVCFYWFGSRYMKRNFWPLLDGEAKLVQIIVQPSMRSRGIATSLIASSFQDMMHKDFSRVYARIWHSNDPSLRAFERAGWKKIGLIIEINPFRRARPIRIRLGTRSA